MNLLSKIAIDGSQTKKTGEIGVYINYKDVSIDDKIDITIEPIHSTTNMNFSSYSTINLTSRIEGIDITTVKELNDLTSIPYDDGIGYAYLLKFFKHIANESDVGVVTYTELGYEKRSRYHTAIEITIPALKEFYDKKIMKRYFEWYNATVYQNRIFSIQKSGNYLKISPNFNYSEYYEINIDDLYTASKILKELIVELLRVTYKTIAVKKSELGEETTGDYKITVTGMVEVKPVDIYSSLQSRGYVIVDENILPLYHPFKENGVDIIDGCEGHTIIWGFDEFFIQYEATQKIINKEDVHFPPFEEWDPETFLHYDSYHNPYWVFPEEMVDPETLELDNMEEDIRKKFTNVYQEKLNESYASYFIIQSSSDDLVDCATIQLNTSNCEQMVNDNKTYDSVKKTLCEYLKEPLPVIREEYILEEEYEARLEEYKEFYKLWYIGHGVPPEIIENPEEP